MKHFFCLISLFFAGLSPLYANTVNNFSFSNSPIDVVIPCVEKDLLTLDLCIHGIQENGVNIRRIIIVSKQQLTNEAEWFDESDYPFSFADVAMALADYDPTLIDSLLQKGSRTGWYYQQLLKLYAPLVIPDISPNVLVLDSDAIFFKPVIFLNENNAGMYNPGEEYHIPYFEHAARLIPGFYKCFPEYSGISHHMIFQKPMLEALLEEVEHYHGIPFWQIFCKLVDRKDIIYSGASEYEIYFNYAFSHTNQVSIRELKWANITKMSEIQTSREKKLDYVCLHSFCREEE